MRVVELSEGGATLADAPELPAQAQGTLSLAAVPFALPFSAHGGGDGTLHLAFTLDAAGKNAFASMPERLALQRAA